jgi:large subunit ribosomal protein L6
MSRVGIVPVKIPKGVKVEVNHWEVKVEGPKGKMIQRYLPEIDVKIDGDNVIVSRKNETKKIKALHGLYRSLINNMVTGVSKGFEKVLIINGIGYRAEVKGKMLILNLGYSNSIEYPIPEGITITVEANTKLTVNSINKAQLGQVCAEIRSFRPPEPYKGKGIRYENEYVRRKIGKSGIK